MEETNQNIKILRLLKEIGRSLKHSMTQQFKNMNLTGPQGMLLGILSHHGKMKISDLGEKIGLSNSTVSGIVDRLEKRGLIERIRSKEDRRVVYVDVTEEFKKDHKNHHYQVEKKFQDDINSATPEEINIIVKGLETLKKVIDRQDDTLK